MKSAVLFTVSAAAGLAAAQAGLEGQPACATPCLTSAISAVCTPATDQACACASQSEIGAQAAGCLLSNCNAGDLAQAQSAGSAACVSFSATASETGSASATGSSSASSNASVTSFTSSSAAASATGATNGTSTGSSSSESSESSTASSTRTSSSSSGSSSASGSAASASSTAGAAFVGPAVSGGLLGGFLAVVAAFL